MFTWICPKCKAEVPPAYTECPRCSADEGRTPATVSGPPRAAGPPLPPQAPPQPPPAYTQPAPAQPAYVPQATYAPPQYIPQGYPPMAYGPPVPPPPSPNAPPAPFSATMPPIAAPPPPVAPPGYILVPATAAPPPPPPPVPQPMAAPEPVRHQVAQAPAPSPAAPKPATYAAPEPKTQAIPSWLASVLTVVAIGAGLALLYYLVSGRKSVDPSKAAAATTAAQPGDEPKSGAGNTDLTKNLEFTGLRVQEDKNQKVEVRMLAVNHTLGELPPMKLDVQLKTVGRPDVLAEFTADLPSMGPLETREIKTLVKTKMRAYELPDWQFLRAEVAADAKETK